MPVDSRQSRAWLFVSVGLVALVVIGAFVVFVLPFHVAPQQSVSATVQTPVAPSSALAGSSVLVSNQDKEASERLQKEALRRQIDAETGGAPRWGAEARPVSFKDAQQELTRANGLHDRQAYQEASRGYQRAIDLFIELDASRDERFDVELSLSRAAYAAEQPDIAQQHADLAVLLQPDNSDASEALQKAKRLPELLAHLADAREYERAGDLQKAIEHYDAVLALDPDKPGAQESRDKLQVDLDQRNFQSAISAVIAALDRKDFGAANAALTTARRLRPSSSEIRDLTVRIQSGSQAATLEFLQRQASRLEIEEKWSEALALYERALGVDRNASFAERGKMFAQQLVNLHKELNRYIADPQRLYSADPLTHAQGIAKQAEGISGAGPQLTSKTQQLVQLIAVAMTPVQVRIRSDQMTDVMIYRVGRLGLVSERALMLRPSIYTVVGTRAGYRDVRREIEVTPSANELVVTIQCVEALPR